jgi:hypothetical protein
MSRFIDKISRIRQNEPQPIGFAALGRSASEKPRLQVVAYMKTDNPAQFSGGLNSPDAELIEINKVDDVAVLEKACAAKSDIPIGGFLKASNAGTIKKAISVACDFVAFPGSTPLTVTQKDKIGRVLILDTSLNERFLRATGDLPVDAVLVLEKEGDALTFNRLMLFQHLINSINKPLLVSIPFGLTDSELQALWDMGISGVVVEMEDEKSLEKLAELRKSIEKLEPPAFRKKFKGSPTLPRVQAEPEKPSQEEEGDGEEEDE